MTAKTLLLLTGLGAGLTGLAEGPAETRAATADARVTVSGPPLGSDAQQAPRGFQHTGAQPGEVVQSLLTCVLCWS